MELKVIGTGSKGNCYLLHNGTEALLIEAGMPFMKVSRAIGPGEIRKIRGCIITHEHGDHAGHVKEVLDHAIPVYCTAGTHSAIGNPSRVWRPKTITFIPGITRKFMVGGFGIIPFAVDHDAAEPCGFYIHHEDMGCMLFATDTARIIQTFNGISHVLIECNHDPELLQRREDIPQTLKDRIARTHMSLQMCQKALADQDLSLTQEIILIHISEGDGDAEAFREAIERQTRKKVIIAKPGLNVEVNNHPF